MQIVGFQKLTMVDYPGKIAAIIFTPGCNFACPFCHNSEILDFNKKYDLYEENEIFSYLEKRKGIIEAIVISGGEPTLQKDLINFLEKLKEYNIFIKLDTNGSNPNLLGEIISRGLVNYVAMDLKNTFEKYAVTCGLKNINVENIKQSIEILKNSKIDYEFRTTIVKEFHDIKGIEKMIDIAGSSNYYLQNFEDGENVKYSGLHGFSEEDLEKIKERFPNIKIRGI